VYGGIYPFTRNKASTATVTEWQTRILLINRYKEQKEKEKLSGHNMKILLWCLCTEIAGNDYISLHNSSRKFSECGFKYFVVIINCKIPSDSQFYGSQVTHYSSANN
jgi:hypothetical protein